MDNNIITENGSVKAQSTEIQATFMKLSLKEKEHVHEQPACELRLNF